ncbi:hypothetical protein LTR16_009442, partial [Cryomyces antarcticus]
RYLRARKFDPKQAFRQFKDTEDWRKENELDKLYDTIDVDEYEETRKLVRPQPCELVEIALTIRRTVPTMDWATRQTRNSSLRVRGGGPEQQGSLCVRAFYVETSIRLHEDPHQNAPTVRASNNIVDISKVGLKQFWNLKQHMQDASTLATAHYPETLDRIF